MKIVDWRDILTLGAASEKKEWRKSFLAKVGYSAFRISR